MQKTQPQNSGRSSGSTPEEQAVLSRINKRFARHSRDELMLGLKTLSRRYLLKRIKGGK